MKALGVLLLSTCPPAAIRWPGHGPIPWCRYTVRELGFADFGDDHVRLHVRLPRDVPEEALQAWRGAANAVWTDATLDGEVSASALADAVCFEWTRSDGEVRFVEVGPIVAGVSRDELRAQAFARLESSVDSPARRRLLDALPSAFTVALIVEAPGDPMQERIRRVVEQAWAGCGRILERSPKPVRQGPLVVTIRAEEIEREKDWLFVLGVDLERAETQVVLLTGRGRRVGEVLGAEITEAVLLEGLERIGADCECDLPRPFWHGAPLPARWDAACRARISAQLGVDVDQPLVRSEMRQLRDRKPGRGARGVRENAIASYVEEPVQSSDSAEPYAPQSQGPSPTPAHTPSTRGPDLGWLGIVLGCALSASLGLAAVLGWRRKGR